ncbi:hypothetical protein GY45DRAFT_1366864 [Cubamyces sp. BRFM 1775]|nr:hypothetical protein GY45DRAFT_1366864 [Cubamyces sp. BRFM 1775]
MHYCSRECQKADWKEHKLICKAADGTPAPSRPPAIKVAEKITKDDEIMGEIDGILVKAMDLEHHPERADTHAVMLTCRVASVDTKLAMERLQYAMSGREPPPLPPKVPKLFIIVKAALLPNGSVPKTLDDIADKTKAIYRAQGLLKPGSGDSVIRVVWVAEGTTGAACYCARIVNQALIENVATWKKPDWEGDGYLDEPISTADMIKGYNLMVMATPELKKKLTIMVSTKDS